MSLNVVKEWVMSVGGCVWASSYSHHHHGLTHSRVCVTLHQTMKRKKKKKRRRRRMKKKRLLLHHHHHLLHHHSLLLPLAMELDVIPFLSHAPAKAESRHVGPATMEMGL